MNNDLIEKIESSIENFEKDFLAYKNEQNKKIENIFKVSQRPYLGNVNENIDKKSIDFKNYVRKGEDRLVKGLVSQGSENGGFLVPNHFTEIINEKLKNLSPMRSVRKVVQIYSDSLEIIQDNDFGDVGWASETVSEHEAKVPEFSKMIIPTYVMYAKTRASQKLIDDVCIDLESWLVQKISEKMACQENMVFTDGDGRGKPKGLLAEQCVLLGNGDKENIECVLTGDDGCFDKSDILIETVNSLPTKYLNGAVWMMSRSVLAAIRMLKNSSTGHYLWQPSLGESSPQTLLGYPIILNDDMQSLTLGKPSNVAVFGNFSDAYRIVDRQEINVLRDPYSSKPFVEFYTTKRVGGALINANALKVVRASKGV